MLLGIEIMAEQLLCIKQPRKLRFGIFMMAMMEHTENLKHEEQPLLVPL